MFKQITTTIITIIKNKNKQPEVQNKIKKGPKITNLGTFVMNYNVAYMFVNYNFKFYIKFYIKQILY